MILDFPYPQKESFQTVFQDFFQCVLNADQIDKDLKKLKENPVVIPPDTKQIADVLLDQVKEYNDEVLNTQKQLNDQLQKASNYETELKKYFVHCPGVEVLTAFGNIGQVVWLDTDTNAIKCHSM